MASYVENEEIDGGTMTLCIGLARALRVLLTMDWVWKASKVENDCVLIVPMWCQDQRTFGRNVHSMINSGMEPLLAIQAVTLLHPLTTVGVTCTMIHMHNQLTMYTEIPTSIIVTMPISNQCKYLMPLCMKFIDLCTLIFMMIFRHAL